VGRPRTRKPKTCTACGQVFEDRTKAGDRRRCRLPGCGWKCTCYYCKAPFVSHGPRPPTICRAEECQLKYKRNRQRAYYRRPENVEKVKGWWANARAKALAAAKAKQAELAKKGIKKCLTAIRDPSYPYVDKRKKRRRDRVCENYKMGWCYAVKPEARCPLRQADRPGCSMFKPTSEWLAKQKPAPDVPPKKARTPDEPGTGSAPASDT